MAAISLTSAPAAKTRSPPHTTTAATSSRRSASRAASSSSVWTCASSAFILGRSRRIVPTPSVTSSRTNSAMSVPPVWVAPEHRTASGHRPDGLQRLPRQPVGAPLLEVDRAERAVELDRRGVPVQHLPLQPAVAALHAHLGELGQQGLAQAA